MSKHWGTWRSALHAPRVGLWIAAALLLAFFAQAILAAPRLSLTADEPVYLAAGYAYLRTGDLRLQPSVQHPPLMNVWAAWPLLLRPDTPPPSSVTGWSEANLSRFIRAVMPRLGPVTATAFAGRVPVLWLAVLLAACVYRWAADVGGRAAGTLALALFAFDPNLIAHSMLATTDLGVAAFTFIALYGLRRGLRRPAWPAFALAGLGLGLAMTAKTSGVFLAAVFALIAVVTWRPGRALARLAGLLGLACLTVWIIMGGELRTPGGWPVPLPAATYWLQVADFSRKSAGGQTAFLMGQLSSRGWWYYYPVAFALKTPLPVLILLAASVASALRKPGRCVSRAGWGAALTLGAFPVLYGAAALFSAFNTGYRFLLPVLPFVFVFIGVQIAYRLSRIAYRMSYIARGSLQSSKGEPITLLPCHLVTLRYAQGRLLSPCLLVSVLFVWNIVGTVRIFPDYLAYFNELAGGPDNGYRWLVDSNLDWGQSLIELRAYAAQRGLPQVNLSQFTLVDPAWYGLYYRALPPMRGAPLALPARFDPAPGVYAIGATTLQGVMLAEPDTLDWFRHQAPLARLGHALFVYDVPPRARQPAWVAQCAALLPLEVIAEGFGRRDLRRADFDCDTSWLFPAGGLSPGWYVLPYDEARNRDRFIAARLSGTRTSYEQRVSRELPALAIYERPESPAGTICANAPQKLDGPLSFLGYAVRTFARPGQTIEVETCWLVTAMADRPLSLMLHLVSPNGSAQWVGDGLGVPVDQWQVGDVIVQRHRIELPPDAPAGQYRLLTGAYWLDTLERFAVLVNDQPSGDQLTLSTLEVRR